MIYYQGWIKILTKKDFSNFCFLPVKKGGKMDEHLRLFDKISSSIMNFDEDDIFLISELIDNINLLKKDFSGDIKATELISYMGQSLDSLLKNEKSPNIVNVLTEGVDILQKLLDKTNPFSGDFIYKNIEKLINDNPVKSLEKVSDKTVETGNHVENAVDESRNEVRNINSDVLNIFIVEAFEKVEKAQEIILELEDDPDNKDSINELFRIFHTIKGECGFLKIASLGELAHNIENLFDLLRNGEIGVNSSLIDTLLNGIDLAKEILTDLKSGNAILFNKVDLQTYIDSLQFIVKPVRSSIGDVLVEKNKLSEDDVNKIVNEQRMEVFTKKFGEIAVEKSFISAKEIEDSLKEQKMKKESNKEGINIRNPKSDPIIKVKASKINYLVDMIGELLIAEGQINDDSFEFSQIKKITRTLQYASMQLRTEKIKSLFINAKRIVRDLSRKLNKDVEIDVFGEDLEIDRNMIENLEEPLMHLIRNSISHGIEDRESRIAKNKPPEGKITIAAERRGNSIVISISDDGKGLDRDKILKKAIDKGIVKEENSLALSNSEIFNLIFIQGFSTADNVDYVSGRGVGMDIVRSVVTELRGKIDIKTEMDKFTRFSLIFPLNTAIIDGMVVRIEDTTFIIPVSSIINSIKIKKDNVHSIKNSINVINVRDEVIPIIDMKEFFQFGKSTLDNSVGVIVENTNKKKFLLVVDEIIAKKEIVIKSLGRKFNRLEGISSGTVLSGGKIGLVMDIEHIIDYNIKAGGL